MTWPTKVSIELRDIHTFVFLWHGLFVIERRQSSFETGDTSSCKKSIYGRWLLVPLDKYNDKAKGTSCISAKNMCFSCSCILCLFINFIMTIPKNVQFSNHATHRGAAGVLLLLYSFVTVRSLFSQSWPESFEIESQVQRKIFPKAAGISRVHFLLRAMIPGHCRWFWNFSYILRWLENIVSQTFLDFMSGKGESPGFAFVGDKSLGFPGTWAFIQHFAWSLRW